MTVLPQPLLQVQDLGVEFRTRRGTARVLDGISFELHRGQTLGVVGESGCGKSVTALAVMRLIAQPPGRITSGRVLFDGRDLLALSEADMRQVRGNRISMIFQEPMTSLNPAYTVGDQIAEAVRLHEGLSRSAATARAVDMLQAVGIPDPQRRVREYPHQFSGGMRQRVMIAMALACKPDVLIADEPTTALDVTVQAQIFDLIADLRERTGTAVMLITHDMGAVAEMTDRVVVMYAGHIVESGSVTQILREPQHPYTRGLIACAPGARTAAPGQMLEEIPGTVPSLLERGAGCPFADRCGQVMPRCRSELPPRTQVAGDAGRSVLCWLHVPEGAAEAASTYGVPRMTAAADSNTLLQVQGLKVHFPVGNGLFKAKGAVKAVDGVSFNIRRGTTFGIVGESGSGKSTTALAVMRLVSITAGRVLLGHSEIGTLQGDALRRERRRFQMVFQDPYASLNPRKRAGDAILDALNLMDVGPPAGRAEQAQQLFVETGLKAEQMQLFPHQFSGGQRQRIVLARALAARPELVVCDEPVSALDVAIQAQMLNLMLRLQKSHGLTYLFISHDLGVVRHMCDEVAVMYLGRIVEQAPREALFQRPLHPYTRALWSAAPSFDPGARGRGQRIRLQGDPPSPLNIAPGCRFAGRCPYAVDVCKQQEPELRTVASGHTVACHRVDDNGVVAYGAA